MEETIQTKEAAAAAPPADDVGAAAPRSLVLAVVVSSGVYCVKIVVTCPAVTPSVVQNSAGDRVGRASTRRAPTHPSRSRSAVVLKAASAAVMAASLWAAVS